MIDTKYNFDEYIFDNVLEDTYLAIKEVRENIDKWVKETPVNYHRGFCCNKGVTSADCLPTSVCACVTHKCSLFLCL